MNYLDTAKELTEFIRKSPSMFHTIHTVRTTWMQKDSHICRKGRPGRCSLMAGITPRETAAA